MFCTDNMAGIPPLEMIFEKLVVTHACVVGFQYFRGPLVLQPCEREFPFASTIGLLTLMLLAPFPTDGRLNDGRFGLLNM